MKRRKWDGRTKAKIVVEGLGGQLVAELCAPQSPAHPGPGQTASHAAEPVVGHRHDEAPDASRMGAGGDRPGLA